MIHKAAAVTLSTIVAVPSVTALAKRVTALEKTVKTQTAEIHKLQKFVNCVNYEVPLSVGTLNVTNPDGSTASFNVMTNTVSPTDPVYLYGTVGSPSCVTPGTPQ